MRNNNNNNPYLTPPATPRDSNPPLTPPNQILERAQYNPSDSVLAPDITQN